MAIKPPKRLSFLFISFFSGLLFTGCPTDDRAEQFCERSYPDSTALTDACQVGTRSADHTHDRKRSLKECQECFFTAKGLENCGRAYGDEKIRIRKYFADSEKQIKEGEILSQAELPAACAEGVEGYLRHFEGPAYGDDGLPPGGVPDSKNP